MDASCIPEVIDFANGDLLFRSSYGEPIQTIEKWGNIVIRLNQSEITKELHWYLYGKENPDTELVEIYERLDSAADEMAGELVELQDGNDAEQQLDEMQGELKKLVKGFKSYNRAEIKDFLESILF